ncbi:hypothetical protein GCM10008171_20990 [Methylopila jiangsuensis]|uniref:Uncharacterized protein n=1 Tax=Methylopila jiangsuensis TaxID=586230 RepID=A0A9W6JFW4_9HYPH|nr:SDR family NAD(P)-dependent oxidoreductase [Methylopila jiangsuensis]MDR6286807.1 polyketide synthase PksN [Methylopila jiangsuensis]GLK76845.1 hypothetical protein GCM10008171_20990 [Methylopila jiangsuensis]
MTDAICDVTGLERSAVEETSRIEDIGLESLAIVAFGARLERGVPGLRRSFIFDCRTIGEIVDYLLSRHPAEAVALASGTASEPRAPEASGGPEAVPTPTAEVEAPPEESGWPEIRLRAPEAVQAADGAGRVNAAPGGDHPAAPALTAGTSDAVAIIGMQGRLPGAGTLDGFWDRLVEGADLVSEIPADRWSLDGFFEDGADSRKTGRSYAKWGAFLSDVDAFDAPFFGIPPREARLMDPQERLFLECAYHAMESAALAGERSARLRRENGLDIGVFVGVTTNTYQLRGPEHWRAGGVDVPTSMPWSCANRVSYFLNLSGPSLAVDAACSSSLVALHLAVESVSSGECAAAIAGGVNLYLHPAKYVHLCQYQMLSPTGRCHAFGSDADGFVPGEGVGAIVLRRLDDALRDGDRILGVIRGSAVNHSGRTNGYTVPGSRSQAALIRKALDRGGLSPRQIGAVEAHGTGTKLGDPIEIGGLAEALGGEADAPPCAVSSVKSNIGHLEAAAGIASVLKVLLQLKHGLLAPSIHARVPNPDLHLDGTRFFVPQSPVPWPLASDGRRRAGVSSFGAGGACAHVVIEDAPAAPEREPHEGPAVFPLSAQTVGQLLELARRLRSQIAFAGGMTRERLGGVAYTLQCGRAALRFRVAAVGWNAEDLAAQLDAFAADPEGRAVDSLPGAGARDVDGAKLRALAIHWEKGGDVRWGELWARKPIPEDAPHYPFTLERHALPRIEGPAPRGPRPADMPIPPIEIDGSEYYVRDHRIAGRDTVAGAAYVGFLAAALDRREKGRPLHLRDVVWRAPCRPEAGTTHRLHVAVTDVEAGLRLEVSSDDGSAPHCVAMADGAPRSPAGRAVDALEAVRARCARPASADELYGSLPAIGVEFGESFRCVARAWRGAGEALVQVSAPVRTRADGADVPFHAGVLDGVFQAAFFALPEAPKGPMVPVRARAIRLHDLSEPHLFAHVTRAGAEDASVFDYRIFASDGRLLGEVEGLAFRRLPAPHRLAPAERAGDELSLFHPVWVDDPAERSPARIPKSVLALDEDGALTDALRASADYGDLRRVRSGEAFEVDADGDVALDLERDDHLDLLWRLHRAEGAPPDAVVAALWDDGMREPRGAPSSWEQGAGLAPLRRLLPVLRGLARNAGGARKTQLVLACRCPRTAAAAAAMMRSVRLEHPALGCTVIEAERDVAVTAIAEAAAREIGGGAAALRVMRLAGRATWSLAFLPDGDELASAPQEPDVGPGDVVAITGGAGAVGRRIAAALSRPGVRIALLGRSAASDEIDRTLADLRSSGAECGYWSCDCADREALERALDDVRERFGPITGVFHAAGVLRDALFARPDGGAWDAVVRAKVAGADNLDALTRRDPLRWFVVSSALAGVCGNVGQSLYGLANGWLDGFAAERRGRGAPGRTVSVAWPLWRMPDGMQASKGFVERLRKEGLAPLEPDDGARLFAAATWSERATLAPVPGDPVRAAALLGARPASPPSVAPRRAAAPADILPYLGATLARVTGADPAKIDPDAPFERFGLDSLLIVEMSEALRERFPAISVASLFEAQSLRALARLLADEAPDDAASLAEAAGEEDAGDARPLAPAEIAAPIAPEPVPEHAVAIVGLAGRYPRSSDLWDFWDHLREGADLIEERPARARSDREPEGVYARWGSFIDDVDVFDPLFFGISPRDAERMDPQERIFLQTAWRAVEDAGYTPEALSGKDGGGDLRRVAVIAGVMYGEYQFYGAVGGQGLANSSYASIANRVSYCLDFDGPSFAVDSMCSSSLTSIHLACDLLRGGGCDVALAGGVNLSLHSYKFRTLSELKFAASDGRCRSFGEGGDGYVPGEGCGVVVLRRLEDAVAAGDHIYAVIRGGDIGHGARTSGYTVPNPDAQAEVIRRAFARSGVDPARLSYVEAHGTGTSLGDPIEIRGLAKAVGARFPAGAVCAIGSLKSNIGHLEAAAGVAALTKVLLQLKHRKIAPSLHSAKLNPFIDFARTPFRVQRELGEWDSFGSPRVAAISSFGAGGSNAHLVIEEWVEPEPVPDAPEPVCLRFSAPSDRQLREMSASFMKHIERERETPGGPRSLRDIAATLRRGRRRFERRLAVVASGYDELRRRLAAYLAAAEDGAAARLAREGVYVSGLAQGEAPPSRDEARRQAFAWVTGGDDDAVVEAGRWRRAPLPGHAFLRRRFWIGAADGAPSEGAPSADRELAASPARPDREAVTPSDILAKVRAGELSAEDARAMLLAIR